MQRAGSDIISGYGSRTAPCASGQQTTTVTVVADYRVFKKGTAVASAEAYTCGYSFCGRMTDSREITIAR